MSWSRSKAFARTRSHRLKICVQRGLGGLPTTSAWGYLDSHRHRLPILSEMYGRMRQRYLKEHRPSLYSSLILSEKLYPHLLEIDRAAHERMDAMLPRMMGAAGVTEELKARDPMRWVGLMNTLKVQVEETIFQELIFQ